MHQQVLRLDVAVADALGVDVAQRSAHLVHVQLHEQRRHPLPVLRIVLADAVHLRPNKVFDSGLDSQNGQNPLLGWILSRLSLPI